MQGICTCILRLWILIAILKCSHHSTRPYLRPNRQQWTCRCALTSPWTGCLMFTTAKGQATFVCSPSKSPSPSSVKVLWTINTDVSTGKAVSGHVLHVELSQMNIWCSLAITLAHHLYSNSTQICSGSLPIRIGVPRSENWACYFTTACRFHVSLARLQPLAVAMYIPLSKAAL